LEDLFDHPEKVVRDEGVEPVTYRTITGRTSEYERQSCVSDYNDEKDDAQVLIISNAASEGINLKNTRHLYIANSPFTVSRLEQIIGRTVRYKSHETLPKEQQVVDVEILMAFPPESYSSEQKKNLKSTDLRLKKLIDDKVILGKTGIEKILKPNSIELRFKEEKRQAEVFTRI
jgi:superfamily II DNA/RNA helicase